MVADFPLPKEAYEVVCDCMTYNQSIYIEDTMNGFVMQKTIFPFACVIIDDASTDGEQDVIKSYLDRHFDMQNAETYDIETANVIVAKHLVNTNCTFAVYFLKKNLWLQPKLKRAHLQPWVDQCKYVAYCEGDDYWTDPNKLQKQVGLLNERPDVSLCYHPVNCITQDGGNHIIKYEGIPMEATENEIVRSNFITTQSVMVRYDPEIILKISSLGKMPFGDYSTWLLYSQNGILYRMEDVMAVYREGTGMWSTKSRFEQLLYSACGYSKLFSLVQSENNKKVFDDTIYHLLENINNEYVDILNSKDYHLGHLLLDPIRRFRALFKARKSVAK